MKSLYLGVILSTPFIIAQVADPTSTLWDLSDRVTFAGIVIFLLAYYIPQRDKRHADEKLAILERHSNEKTRMLELLEKLMSGNHSEVEQLIEKVGKDKKTD